MKKLAIIADSGTYSKYQNLPEDTFLVNLHINEDSEELPNLSVEELVEIMNANKEAKFTTSQPAPGQFLAQLQAIENEYENAIIICLSSALSGTYQSATQAIDMYEGKMKVAAYDSKACISICDYMAKVALENADNLTLEEIIAKFDEIRNNMHINIMLDTVENIKRSGRLSPTAAKIATLANIKPILELSPQGTLESIGKARKSKKAWVNGVNLLVENLNNPENATFWVLNINNAEGHNFIKEELMNTYGVKQENIHDYPIAALLGVHLGDGATAIVGYDNN